MDPAVELVRAIEEHPYESNVYAVYGDWLVDQGDPRGDLIALQLAAERDPSKAADAEAFLREHESTFIGDLLGFELLDPTAFTWRYGFIHRARLVNYFEQGFETLSEHPSGRFLVELAVGHQERHVIRQFVSLLSRSAPRTLQCLTLGIENGDSRVSGGALESLWPAVQTLRRLVIDGGAYRIGAMSLPQLEHLAIRTSGLLAQNLIALRTARMPMLRSLELSGDDPSRHVMAMEMETLPGVVPELALRDLVVNLDAPHLRHFAVRHCAFTDDVVRTLATSQVLARLESLDLSYGTLGFEGARAMLASQDRFRHLGVLDISHNRLSPATIGSLGAMAHRVIADPQGA